MKTIIEINKYIVIHLQGILYASICASSSTRLFPLPRVSKLVVNQSKTGHDVSIEYNLSFYRIDGDVVTDSPASLQKKSLMKIPMSELKDNTDLINAITIITDAIIVDAISKNLLVASE